jgi:hypothetical protein
VSLRPCESSSFLKVHRRILIILNGQVSGPRTRKSLTLSPNGSLVSLLMIGGHLFLIYADDSVPVELVGGEDVPTASFAKDVPCHKKNPSLGNKKVYYSNKLFVEQEDARTFKVGEEVLQP